MNRKEEMEDWSDDKLAGWARAWHWNDCAADIPVDPSIYYRDMRLLKAFAAALRASAAPEEGMQIWLLAGRLAGAELNYRNAYEQLGGSHIETGRAWDKLRQAGNAIREISDSVWEAALAPATEGGGREITVREVLDWLRNRPGISWQATINDIEKAVADIAISALSPSTSVGSNDKT